MQSPSASSQHDRMMMIAAAIEQRHRMLELQQLREENEYLHEQQFQMHYLPIPLSEQSILQQQQKQLHQLHPYTRPGHEEPPTPASTVFRQRLQQQRYASLANEGGYTANALSSTSTAAFKLGAAGADAAERNGAAASALGAHPRPAQSAHLHRARPPSSSPAAPLSTGASTVTAPSAPVYGPTVDLLHPQFVDMETSATSMVPFGLHDENYLRRIGALPLRDPYEEQFAAAYSDVTPSHDNRDNSGAEEPEEAQPPALAEPQQQPQQQQRPHISLVNAPGKAFVPTPRSQQQQRQQQRFQQRLPQRQSQPQEDYTPLHQTSKSTGHHQQYTGSGYSNPSVRLSPTSSVLGLTGSTVKQQQQQQPPNESTTFVKDDGGLVDDGVSHNLDDYLRAEQEAALKPPPPLPADAAPKAAAVGSALACLPPRVTPPHVELGKAMQQLVYQIRQKKMSMQAESTKAAGVGALPLPQTAPAPAAALTSEKEKAAETPLAKQSTDAAHDGGKGLRDTPPSSRRRPPSPHSRSLHRIQIVMPRDTPNSSGLSSGGLTARHCDPQGSGGLDSAGEAKNDKDNRTGGVRPEARGYYRPASACRSLHECFDSTPNINSPDLGTQQQQHQQQQPQQQPKQQPQPQPQEQEQQPSARSHGAAETLPCQGRDPLRSGSQSQHPQPHHRHPTGSLLDNGSHFRHQRSGHGHGSSASAPFDVLLSGHMSVAHEAASHTPCEVGSCVLFEGDRGVDMARVVRCHRRAEDGTSPHEGGAEDSHSANGNPRHRKSGRPLVLRLATAEEQDEWLNKQPTEAAEALAPCREAVAALKLPLEVVGAVYQFNREKLTFFYESDTRVDFRHLLQHLFSRFHCRIWMERMTPLPPPQEAEEDTAAVSASAN